MTSATNKFDNPRIKKLYGLLLSYEYQLEQQSTSGHLSSLQANFTQLNVAKKSYKTQSHAFQLYSNPSQPFSQNKFHSNNPPKASFPTHISLESLENHKDNPLNPILYFRLKITPSHNDKFMANMVSLPKSATT